MKKSPTVSVVITTFNSEKNIERTLESIAWADEIVVVDGSSTDNTVKIVKRFTPHVYVRGNYPMLNRNKNFGFSKASCDWILCLDSDEVVPPELAKRMKEQILQSDRIAYWIPRKNIIFGKWIQHGLWWPDKQLRLFKRGHGKYPEKHVHEYISVDGPAGHLEEPYLHYNYESISQYLWKLEHIYTENETANLISAGYKVSWFDALRFPISDFLKIYFAQGGYRDGLHGLVLAQFQALYSFVVFAKLWEKQRFDHRDISLRAVSAELKHLGREFRYWIYTAKMQMASPILRVWYRILRKFV